MIPPPRVVKSSCLHTQELCTYRDGLVLSVLACDGQGATIGIKTDGRKLCLTEKRGCCQPPEVELLLRQLSKGQALAPFPVKLLTPSKRIGSDRRLRRPTPVAKGSCGPRLASTKCSSSEELLFSLIFLVFPYGVRISTLV